MEKILLNDGNSIPAVGFGVFRIPNDGSTYRAVRAALDAGYRHIDTAVAYFNEAEVGKAVKDSGIPREEIFVTSKLWLQDYGFDAARKGTVVEVHDGAAQLESHLSASYHSDNNNVLIEHPDGTLCNYSVLEAGSIQVREGDIVYPGTPIARAGSYNEGTAETQVRMLIYFPDEKPNVTSPNTETFFEWVYYNPHFATAEGTCQLQDGRSYQAVSSPELVQAEMTKREIKQMK